MNAPVWQVLARTAAAARHGHTRVRPGRDRVAFGRTDAEVQRKHERINRLDAFGAFAVKSGGAL